MRYSGDDRPGIRRLGRGRSFRYVNPRGRRLRAADLARIRSLVIPPAWRDVWICSDPRGHLQATGRDARGRKQYRYHPKWREVRDGNKYGHVAVFARALPAIRRRTDADLRRAGLPRDKVLAAVVRLLEKTFIRVGNDEYARTNRSFGLATMRDRHVKVSGSTVRFIFRGKSGVEHELTLDDRRLARIVKQCRDLPGQELFHVADTDGRIVDVGSADVNQYLHEIAGREFTSKDFRTWAGTHLAATLLRDCPPSASQAGGRKTIVACDRPGCDAAGEHARRLPEIVRASGGTGRVPRRDDRETEGAARRARHPRDWPVDGVGVGRPPSTAAPASPQPRTRVGGPLAGTSAKRA